MTDETGMTDDKRHREILAELRDWVANRSTPKGLDDDFDGVMQQWGLMLQNIATLSRQPKDE